jgi:uncharacterized membrane protein YsdA (DUF1294 family)
MSDMTLTCVDCNSRFVWSAGEQRFYAKRGLSQPKRCKDCLSHRRRERDSGNLGFSGPPRQVRQPVRQARHRSQPQYTSLWHNPTFRFGILSGTFIVAMIVVLVYWLMGLTWLGIGLAYLFAINLVTDLFYRYDKRVAGGQRTRVPENVLLALAALGASPAAYFAMFSAEKRHKARKTSFQVTYWAIVAVQIIILGSIPIFARLDLI